MMMVMMMMMMMLMIFMTTMALAIDQQIMDAAIVATFLTTTRTHWQCCNLKDVVAPVRPKPLNP